MLAERLLVRQRPKTVKPQTVFSKNMKRIDKNERSVNLAIGRLPEYRRK